MMPQTTLQHAHHCVYDLHYHFVLVVKYRRALLRPEVEAELARISRGVTERYDFEIETLGADLNHVHLLCSAPPKVAPSEIVRIYKSVTTVQTFRALPELKRELWGGKLWTAGFYVASVGQRGGYGALRRYIQDQGKTPEAENLRLLFSTEDPAG
jgi:putative transposase